MERHLDDELQKLNKNLMGIAAMAEEAIHKSIEALRTQNKQMAEACIQDDYKIDEMELQIEEETIELLALFQPMARDLRFITTAMRINNEIERIADLTVNICQRVKELKGPVLMINELPLLTDIAKWMVKSAIDAFVRHDDNMAREVILKDSEANKLRTLIIDKLVDDNLVKDGALARRIIPLLLVTRDPERICDQAKYIAEEVIYLVEAKVVKHHPERLQTN